MLTFLLLFLDANNLIDDFSNWWYLGSVVVDLCYTGGAGFSYTRTRNNYRG